MAEPPLLVEGPRRQIARALLVPLARLFGASGRAEQVKLAWTGPAPRQVWLSDTSELPREKAAPVIEVPGWGIVTLRAE
jgi:hypothetical protein